MDQKKAPVFEYLEEIMIFKCPHCKKRNFVYDCFDGDMSRADTEAIKCWNCGKTSWTADDEILQEMNEYDPEKADTKDGRSAKQIAEELVKHE